MSLAARLRRGRPSPWAFLRDFPRILPYLRPRWPLAAVSLALVAVSAAMTLLEPWPLALIIDSVLGDRPLPGILAPLAGLTSYELLAVGVIAGLAITALGHGVTVIDEYVTTKIDQSMVLDLRSDMVRHAQRIGMAYHDEKRTGQLMFEINSQAAAIGAIVVAIPPLLQSLVTLVGMFFVVYRLEPTLALLALTVVPFIYFSAGYYAKSIQPRLVRVRNLESQSLTIVHEMMAMMRVIVAFGREPHEYERFRRQGEEAVDARVRLTVRQTVFSLVVTMITAIGSALVLGFGAYHVLQSDLSAGQLLVVIGYVASLYKPLEQISNTVGGLQEDFITMQGALALLDTPIQVEDRPGATAIGRATGAVAFEGVSFSYASRRGTLTDVSFAVPAGSQVAIVGPTGAGKSTLLSLLPRFYDPDRGRVLLDGRDVRDATLASLRAQISVVHQEPLLFRGTLRENIRYGRLEATDAEIEDAARAAGAHDFICALPHGYETLVGERGSKLSGGERQRISVARAFLKDAPLLILDEPTSSIDSRTEAVILTALERLMQGRTTFTVAHRLSTIAGADLILVLHEGRVVELGDHAQLLALDGLYAELHEAQHGGRRARTLAAVSSDDLSTLTGAIADGRREGPALARMAQALAERAAADGDDGAWALLAAAWPLLQEGSPDALHALARGTGGPEAARLARGLLHDLGIPPLATERAA